jgi:glycolate oxidase FAD binding subunit
VTRVVAGRAAAAADAVDGVRPAAVVEPGSVEEAAAALRDAAAAGQALAFRGGGSKLGLGNPPERLDLLVSTARLDQVLEHAAGDLVVKVQGGVRLADLQAALAPAGQQLGLDPPEPGATVGGVVAANASGPRRLRYGTARDLIIGITVVLADGTVAHAGGKVVKNVAGYDLAKLFCGSLGTLGLVAEAVFRLHPVPEAAGTVALEVRRPADACAAVGRLLRATVEPSAVELAWPEPAAPGRLTVLLEGIRPGVEARVAATADLLGAGAQGGVADPDAPAPRLGALPWPADGGGPVVGVKAACPPAELDGAVGDLWAAADAAGVGCRLTAHAGSGVLRAALPWAGTDALAAALAAARRGLVARGGSLVLVEAPVELKRAVEVWGPAGDALELMRRVKRRFDPEGRLAPGRFVGGI